jgi:hypothetical protein
MYDLKIFIIKAPGEHIATEETFTMNVVVVVVVVVAVVVVVVATAVVVGVVVVVVVVVVTVLVAGPNTKNSGIVYNDRIKNLRRIALWDRRQ